MINSRVQLLFKNLPEKYPLQLEQNYLSILNRLMQLWGSKEFEPYLRDLLINKRSDRQGFPPDVITELMFLGELHDMFTRAGYRLPILADSWGDIPVTNPTPEGFQQAIEHGQLEVVKVFLGAGIAADFRFEGSQTALMTAAISGQLETVRYLLDFGAGVNLRDGGKYTALHWAAFYRRAQITGELIDAGAEINATQNSGDTPLSLAVTRGYLEVAKVLLELGADFKLAGKNGTPLAIATEKKNLELINLLHQLGAR